MTKFDPGLTVKEFIIIGILIVFLLCALTNFVEMIAKLLA